MKTRVWRMAARNKCGRFVSVGAVALVVTAASLVTASAWDAQLDHDELLAVLAAPQTREDRLPAYLDLSSDFGVEGVIPSSTRFLGESVGADHWTADDRSGQLCLISVLRGPEYVAGITCGTQERFLEAGLSLQLIGPRAAVEAHLLPDGYRSAAAHNPRLEAVTPNLATSDPFAESEGIIELETDDGTESSVLRVADLQPAAVDGTVEEAGDDSVHTTEIECWHRHGTGTGMAKRVTEK